jgi:hypothetical protein
MVIQWLSWQVHLAKQVDEVVVFVEQQHGPLLLTLVLHDVENLIGVKVFTPSCVAIWTELKIDCIPILNWLQLDSKWELG